MTRVSFFLDLGDVLAVFTGRVIGRADDDIKAVYYCPVARNYLPIDLTPARVLDIWNADNGILPLQPELYQVEATLCA